MELVGAFVKGDTGATYEVRVNDAGLASCTCPSWRFGGREQGACKHMRFALEILAKKGLIWGVYTLPRVWYVGTNTESRRKDTA